MIQINMKLLLAILTIIAQVIIVLIILLGKRTDKYIKKYVLLFAFIVAVTATSGSLYFSEIAGYVPCKLCWFQRIMIYPLAIILLVALIRKDNNVWPYVLSLSSIDILISGYHYYIQLLNSSTFCTIGEECTTKYFTLGYISIPLMSFTAALLISILMLKLRKHIKSEITGKNKKKVFV